MANCDHLPRVRFGPFQSPETPMNETLHHRIARTFITRTKLKTQIEWDNEMSPMLVRNSNGISLRSR